MVKLRILNAMLLLASMGCSKDFPNDYLTTNLALLMSKCQAGSVTGSYRNAILSTPGLWAYYTMGSNPAEDVSGNGKTGAYSAVTAGLTGTIAGASDTAVFFDNAFNSNISTLPSFDPSTTDFSVETWFNPTTLIAGGALGFAVIFAQSGGNAWLGLDLSNSDQLFSGLGGTGFVAGVAPKTGSWYHAVLTKSGTSVRIYVNGQLKVIKTVTVSSSAGTFLIGGAGVANSGFTGYMDDTSVYTKALTLNEITNHYLLGRGKSMVVSPENTTISANSALLLQPLGGIAPFAYSILSGAGSMEQVTDVAIFNAPAAAAATKVRITDAGCNSTENTITTTIQPDSFSDLTLWLDAANITGSMNGGIVSAWPDYSGSGYSATGVPTFEPTWVPLSGSFPGKPIVRFISGASTRMIITPSQASSFNGLNKSFTFFIVFLTPTPAASMTPLEIFDGLGLPASVLRPFSWAAVSTYSAYRQVSGVLNITASSGPLADATAHIATSVFDGTSVSIYIDGNRIAPAVNAQVLSLINPLISMDRMTLGANLSLANFMNGDIAEMILYKRTLSATEQKNVECYLAVKYQLLTAITNNSCP